MCAFMKLILILLLIGLSYGFKGKIGKYVRLFDISSLCPYLSFVQPWSDGQDTITLLDVGNVSVTVTALDMETITQNITDQSMDQEIVKNM